MDTTKTVTFVFLVVVLLWNISNADDMETNCTFNKFSKSEGRLHLEGENTLTDSLYQFTLSGNACVVNMTKLFSVIDGGDIKDLDSTSTLVMVFFCVGPTEILFTTPNRSNPNSTFLLHFVVSYDCTISVETLVAIDKCASTAIYKLIENDGKITGREHQSCSFANTIRGMELALQKNQSNVLEFCTNTFPILASLTLKSSGSSLYSLPHSVIRSMPQRFPSLQQLLLIDIDLEAKVYFPWIGTTLPFVANFTNDKKAQHLKEQTEYDDKIYLYNRFFQLKYSNTTSLNIEDCIQLNGSIINVEISGLIAKSFSRDYFYEISGLQTLSISNNKLQFIHPTQFSGQHHLIKLDCSKNLLVSLDEGIFEDLHNLKFLDLSDNKLEKLPPALLRNCQSLFEIHLHRNGLAMLPYQFFKPVFDSIKTADLSFNPITEIPLLLIYAPGIQNVVLKGTHISDDSITLFLSQLDLPDMGVRKKVELEHNNSNSQPKATRMLDLSFCQINSIRLSGTFTNSTDTLSKKSLFAQLIETFSVNFKGNPLYCACDIAALQYVFMMYLHTTDRGDYTYNTLVCDSPPQLKGRLLASVKIEEMYCPVDLQECPAECSCSERADRVTLVIDCQGSNISKFPNSLPTTILELWFKSSMVDMITFRTYLTNVTVLDVRDSKVNYINPAIFGQLKKLKLLYLDSNLMTSLPDQLSGLNLTAVTLGNNPYLCDCRLAWMKQWLIEQESTIKDWENVKCTDGRKKGQQVVTVDDTHFICSEETSFDSVRHVVFPSIITSCVAIVLMAAALIVFVRRNDIKVLLYIYCGLHPFDKNSEGTSGFDAVAIYDFDDKYFMQKVVIEHLSSKGFKIADMYNDFIVGLTFTDNVKHFVQDSRRMIFLLSNQTTTDELMVLAWSLAYEKSLNSITNYIIVIQNNTNVESVNDTTLYAYLKHRRCIRKESSLLKENILYCMPTHEDRREDEQRIVPHTNSDTFLSYPDTLHEYVKDELMPAVQNKTGHMLGLFEYQFQPGGSLDEEILNCLGTCHRLIFILSNEALRDEIKMMILKYAMAKNMTCDYNFLLVFTYRQVSASLMTVDVRDYVDKHVTVRLEDENFIDRLATALRFRQQASAVPDEAPQQHDAAIDNGITLPLM